VPAWKVRVIPNGIDAAPFREDRDCGELRRSLGIPAAAPVIGTVGRLSEIKRQDLMIRAFAEAIRRVPDAHLLLVGDGPLRESLQTLADELGLSRRVHLVGYQDRPERYLQVMDIFALTSRSEGMPLAVLEAWAAARPVVASRVGGLPEMVEDGRTGILVPSGDQTALANTLIALATNPELRRQMGGAGRHEVESRFDVGTMAENYARHYRELLGRREGTAACES